MARTKRTTRTTRKPAGTIDRVKAVALAQAKIIARQGAALQTQGRKLAVAKAAQARKAALARAKEARAAINAGAEQARSRATEIVTRFEKAFEDRVGRAIGKLGVPTARDVRALSRQVAHLQQSVDQLRRTRARA